MKETRTLEFNVKFKVGERPAFLFEGEKMKYNLMPIKYFVDVVQTQGFISAAKRNFVSETAVSTAIKKLEKDLGHKLINRSAGEFSLTEVGKTFYERSLVILSDYEAIWLHPDQHPDRLVRIHFLEGLSDEAALLGQKLKKYHLSFDEELLSTSVSNLLNDNFDILVGFELAFKNNAKIQTFPLRHVSFDLLFNSDEVEKESDLHKLAADSALYLQYWQSGDLSSIQAEMISKLRGAGWDFDHVAGVNSFDAAALNVSLRGGFTMIPDNYQLPKNCDNLHRISCQELKNNFLVVAGVKRGTSDKLINMLKKAII